ncbi:hypothetical protein OSB04_020896 [Centaurea solstitialis]|uniref:Reverse transcriptase Ty1/copia-type domain-containing protein n=1 Tax=Centaurea solstitialis TaxID=347529 RepID=A0AA38STJ1_9ASTR|nr:hypothetical protein OSB04_020896 [Centaurea solstitialis]
MQAIRDHLNLGAPQVHDNTAKLYQAFFNQLHLITILMSLLDKFENVRASLLHRHPLPSLEDAITELLSKETRLQLRTPAQAPSESVFYTHSSSKSKGKGFQNFYNKPSGKPSANECTFCHSPSHFLIDCPIRKCNCRVCLSIPDLMELMCRNQELMAQIMTASLGMNSQHSTPSGLAIGLVSPTQLQEMGLLMFFDFSGSVIQDPKTKQTLGVGRRVGRILEVVYIRIPLQPHSLVASVSQPSSLDLWHARLGHLSSSRMKLLASSGSLGHVTPTNISCLPCKLGKHHALPFEINESKSSCPFDLIHSDVWGPAPHPSMGGARVLSLSTLVLALHPKMVAQNANIGIYLTLYALSLSLPNVRNASVFTAVYTINRHPTPILQHKSPYEVLHGVSPAYDLLKSNINSTTPFFTDSSLSLDTPFTTLIPTPVPDSPATISDPSPPVPSPSPTSETPTESTDLGTTSSETVHHSDQVRQVPAHLRDYHYYATLLSNHEPTSYKEAAFSSHWQAAMQEKLRALAKAQTWDPVPLPPGKRPIGSKWEYDIDYEETFAPVARVTSVRSLLAIAATKHWPLFQMDVKNAFLNGDLSEEAPRAWFEKFSNTVLSLGFSASNYDSGLFTRTTDSGSILLLLYVDDMIIIGDDSIGIASLKQSLSSSFEMKDLDRLHYFLGLEVLSDSSGTYLCQAKYISDLLSKAGLSDNKVASTPLEHNLHLASNSGLLLQNPTRYRQLVGSLVYLIVTRPDIAYAVHTINQFMAAPCFDHYATVVRILRYLKGTMFHGLHFSSKSLLVLRGFSDSDWDSDMTDRRSTTSYCFFLCDSLISWRSKKQSLTARSSTEAEYRALAETSQELIWLRWLLSDMGTPQTSPTPLCCDNNSAIQIAHNDVFHERTKHIEIDCHFVRQHVVRNIIQLQPISTQDQPTDIFTKAHLPGRFRELITKLNLSRSSPDPLQALFISAPDAFGWQRKNKDLMDLFFENAAMLLSADGEVHVTNKTTFPHTEWDLEKIAERSLLKLMGTTPFNVRD